LPTYSGNFSKQIHLVGEHFVLNSDGVKDMTHEAKAKAMTHEAKAKDLTCHAALKPQTLYTVQC